MKDCNQCGKCCIKYGDGGLSATADEISWWDNTAPQIARYVRDGLIWMDPQSGRQLARCPWLNIEQNGRYTCAIYHNRPDDCRHYPTRIAEMVADECEMLEITDLTDTAKAQQALDKLMSDSRPSAR